MAGLDYTPAKRGFELRLRSRDGLEIAVLCPDASEDALVTGAVELRSNLALMEALLAYGKNEFAYRRARSPEKRTSHREAALRYAKDASGIADLVGRLSAEESTAWCSGCFERTAHRHIRGSARPKAMHLCGNCGTPTVRCALPRCRNHAAVTANDRVTLSYCAPHRHEIPSFEKLTVRLGSLEESGEWLKFDHRNADRITKVTGGTIGAAVVIAPAAFFAAPVIGAALGGSALGGGLTGAAATSHGLAMIGGGSVAAGGLGMAGGTAVVTATGSALGGILGATTTSAYVSSDKSFRIEKLRDGRGPVVVLASGFLTQGKDGWGPWQPLIDHRYPDATVYRVHWGSKELKSLGILAGVGAGKVAARKVVASAGKKGSKAFSSLPGIGWVLAAHDIAANPWTVAKNRAAMTGAILADLIARTDDGPYVLIGHSLGARVMVHAAQALGTRATGEPQIETMHLLGAAVGNRGDWRSLDAAVSGVVWNYWSGRDEVLGTVYAIAELGQKSVGSVGFGSKFPRIKDRNVTRTVGGHSVYFDGVQLA
ncbi:DUF726 domain-containing protein [Nocardioides sp. MAHUQ-72]|uniref:DUF726 domain-containing protein n=1 Tax=unclassified Nocardioides TaxID=2615069 RepID=UPI00360D28E5